MRTPFSKVVPIDGKDYTFELTVDAHRRVKAQAQISLPDCVADVRGKRTKEEQERALDGFNVLMADFDRLPLVMYAMIEPQLKENGITSREQFERKLKGSTFLAGGRAITEALIDFFHDDPRGKLLDSAVEAAQRMEAISLKMHTKATQQLDRSMTEMDAKIDEQGDAAARSMIHETLTNSLKTLPASLAAILVPSPSGS